MANKVTIEVIESPLKSIDLNNLPFGSIDDFIAVLKCCNYVDEFPNMKKEADILFEGLVKAGKSCGIIDDYVESIWRNQKGRSEKQKKLFRPKF